MSEFATGTVVEYMTNLYDEWALIRAGEGDTLDVHMPSGKILNFRKGSSFEQNFDHAATYLERVGFRF